MVALVAYDENDLSAAMTVRMPVTTHAPRYRAGELVSRAISASTRKMPDPIIDPITSAVELVSPRPFTNCWSSG